MALCARPNCGKPSWNGQPKEFCSRTCKHLGLIQGEDSVCARPGCNKPSWNGKPGEFCGKTCKSMAAAICARPDCSKPSWNGKPGQFCSKTCKALAGEISCCMRDGCDKPTWNGKPNEYCGRKCRTASEGVVVIADPAVCAAPGCGKPPWNLKAGFFCSKGCRGEGAVLKTPDKPDPVPDGEKAAQQALGGQTSRGGVTFDLSALGGNEHAQRMFHTMREREERLCPEWVVFYHSYNSAALIYELQASIAEILFHYNARRGSLPRLLMEPFYGLPNAKAMMARFPSWPDRDHNQEFKNVGICTSTSLITKDPEATPVQVFLQGYGASAVTAEHIEKLLSDCGAGSGGADLKLLTSNIMEIADKQKTGIAGGHMLQIFMHRSVVDEYAYAALPYGVIDHTRQPLSHALAQPGPIGGQGRLTCNPAVFMRANFVRIYISSADEAFHNARLGFQGELVEALSPIIGSASVRRKAAEGIYGGKLPSWYKDLGDGGAVGEICAYCGIEEAYNNKKGGFCSKSCKLAAESK